MSGGHESAPDAMQPVAKQEPTPAADAVPAVAPNAMTQTVPVTTTTATPSEPASSLVTAPMGGAWQPNTLQPLKIRPLPVPAPSITIPPPVDVKGLGAADVSMTPRPPDLNAAMTLAGGTNPAFMVPALGQFPVQAGTAAEGEGGKMLSPLKVNVALRPKPTEMSDTSPVPPAVVKDLHFDPRYQIPETWPFETSNNVYAMLIHPSQQLDLSYQQMLAAKGIVSPLMHLQQQQEQPFLLRHPGLPLQASPIGTRMQPFYPQQTIGTPNPHQIAVPYLNSGLPSPFSPTASLSAINLSDIMMVGDPGLFLPPNSPTNILKHLLPPIVPQHLGLNVKDITLNELRPHFNKPMAVVAKELGVCITLMKKICRRNGLVRWPHRRIRSLVNRITSLQVIAGNASDAEQKRFLSQIAALREELSAVIQNPNEKSRKAQADAKARSPSLRSCADEAGEDDEDGHAEGDEDDDEEMLMAEEDDEKLNAADLLSSTAPASSSSSVGAPLNSSPDRSAFLKVVHKDDARKDQDTKFAAVCDNEDLGANSKKRKEFVSQNMPPPPIKIPCHRAQQRTCRHDSSALGSPSQNETDGGGDQVGGKSQGEDAPDGDLERPSSTTSTSSKRGSISSILCDPNE
uniref:RWP-RK domain-containing protein n=1 Tax=Globisporangium ultimum (strain ATCC 200006 / CBS 805.95 / DAOM BR144) TaxID=431595 RepID=K3XAN6_GLOUD